jgi:hypothetical protein
LNLEVTCVYDHYMIEVIAGLPELAVLRCPGPLDLVVAAGPGPGRESDHGR